MACQLHIRINATRTFLDSYATTFQKWATTGFRLFIAVKELQEQIYSWLYLEVNFTKDSEVANIHNGVGRKILGSQAIICENITEEMKAGQPETPT